MSTDAPATMIRALDEARTAADARATLAGVAGLLSFAWPGAGQAFLGAPRLAILLGLPQLIGLIGLAAAWLGGPSATLAWLLNPANLLVLIALDLLMLATRLVAVIDASRRTRPWGRRRPIAGLLATCLLAGMIFASAGIHGVAAQVAWSAVTTLTTVFSPEGPRGAAFTGSTPSPSARAPATAAPAVEPTATPSPSPTRVPIPDWAADGRLNLLIVGADAGPGRWKLRTDTMILLTVDVASGRAALVGIPRNLRNVPLPPPLDAEYPDGFPDLLNALWVHVDERPGSYPGEAGIAPYAAVQETVGLLTGVTVDGMAVAELQGFVRAVDAIGGLELDIPAAVYDARYPNPDGTGNVELYIAAGQKHLDGWHALAYARTRHQDGDYWRMERQQTVLVALQRQLRCNLVSSAPELLAIARDTMWISLPLEELPSLVELARRIDPAKVARLTLTPPTYPDVLDDAAVERIRSAVRDIFAGAATDSASPAAIGGDSSSAPACD